jgi:competence protein ComEC
LRLSYGRFDVLFAGDLDAKDEKRLVAAGAPVASAVLKIPSHGSPRANSDEFVRAVGPRIAVFSLGPRSAAQAEEIIERYAAAGAATLRTDSDGAIMLETDGETLRYRTYRGEKTGVIAAGS